ncbi:transcription termination factor Rho [Babesia caballi]|uniref:Transcription termination factor Rho n=1 Tax=Babesia caballi TaxID=5871 RepID=A0AAV4LQV2_BABCB|nr:transcription termination factor Rho [Babesia caballi]
MVWEGVELKLPEEVASSVSLDTRKRSTDFPNVRITNFASGERMLPGEDNGLMSEEELHEGMMDHVNWLMEQFSSSVIHLDITYAAPRYRLTKPLCYMLGLNSEFLFSGRTQDIDVSAGVDPPDPFLASVTSSLFTQEASFTDANKACGSADLSASTPDISRLVQEVDQFGGLELSDDGDDSDSSGMDSDPEEGVGEKRSASQRSRGKRPSGSSPSGDRAVAAHLDLVERVRQKCPNLQSFSNFEETIVHDYYSSRGSQVLDISAIESQLLGEGPDGAKPNDSPASAALDELVLTHIEKGDMHGFTQLVSTLRPRKTMVGNVIRVVHNLLFSVAHFILNV